MFQQQNKLHLSKFKFKIKNILFFKVKLFKYFFANCKQVVKCSKQIKL